MASEREANEAPTIDDAAEPDAPGAPRPHSRILKLLLLVVGLGLAAYLAKVSPQEQHVRIVLGDQRWTVKVVDLQYLDDEGDVARAARLTYPNTEAPRVIAHEPELPDGTYRLRIDIDTREGRRSVERQVTLGGGSTQVDISSALAPEDKKAP